MQYNFTLDIRKGDTLEYAATGDSKNPLLHLMHLWAFESICAIFLNSKVGALPSPNAKQSEEALEFVRIIGVVFKHTQKLLMGIPLWKFLPQQVLRTKENVNTPAIRLVLTVNC